MGAERVLSLPLAAEMAERRRQLGAEPASMVEEVLAYGAVVGSRVEFCGRLPSCLDYARTLIRDDEAAGRSFASGRVLIASELEAGRGRFARPWHAPAGGLWLTMVLVNTLLPQHARFYPLAAGVAVAETLRSFGIPAHLKWVNDILVNGRKIAGMLLETDHGLVRREEYVLLGIGLNVNNGDFPPDLQELAVSMRQVVGRKLDLKQVAARLLVKLRWQLGLLHYIEARQLAAEGDSGEPPADHPLLASWRELSDCLGRRVLFGFNVQQQPQYEAVVEDIDPAGGLVMRLVADGRRVIEYAGEIQYLS
ncbi:MAG: biotin--[acetyl-CoA-carboxylase] ligase [Desulfurivibrio sp.]|nr:biotin--[acetyl-CoA-carboxylase] ligase [Desulfurivibrio sp.]